MEEEENMINDESGDTTNKIEEYRNVIRSIRNNLYGRYGAFGRNTDPIDFTGFQILNNVTFDVEEFINSYKSINKYVERSIKKKQLMKLIEENISMDDDGNIMMDQKLIENPGELGLKIIRLGRSIFESDDIKNITDV